MSALPNDPPLHPASCSPLAWALGSTGLTLTSVGAVLTFGPWAAIALGVIPADTAILFAFAAPALAVMVLIGCGCSTGATFVAGRSGCGAASALGFGGFVLAAAYGAALWPTGMHRVVIGLWPAG